MSKPVRKTILDTIAQFAIDKGCDYIEMLDPNPLNLCKMGLKKIEECNKDRFIENVLASLAIVDIKSLDAEKFLRSKTSLKTPAFKVQIYFDKLGVK